MIYIMTHDPMKICHVVLYLIRDPIDHHADIVNKSLRIIQLELLESTLAWFINLFGKFGQPHQLEGLEPDYFG